MDTWDVCLPVLTVCAVALTAALTHFLETRTRMNRFSLDRWERTEEAAALEE